ncbi:MAG: S8/S53 family peptidase [Rudaea sp.]|uniref:S53 family peptidase n=1 Tax=unclassified Rudaea TaxID=2627037 RepID=UPI001484D456|nr:MULTISPECIES: S53 family peptidase [unclassified Rudaea]MBN8886009.1 S8/S53 family peptidase [Rudaea sp.]
MIKRTGWTMLGLLGFACAAQAAAVQPVARVAAKVDDAARVTLAGNVRPEATAANDLGAVADTMPLDHMQLLLRRSPEQERALASAIDALHDPASPTFHHWLSAEQFGAQYGVAQADVAAVTGWLTAHGFTVNRVYANALTIDFSGSAGAVHDAFRTEIHRLAVKGARHFANMSDPQIPAALASVVKGVVSLNDFRPHAMAKRAQKAKFLPQDAASGGGTNLAPADLATIYNFNPVFAAGNTGQGQTIVVVEDTDVYSAQDWTTFRSKLGLAGYTTASLVQVHPAPKNGANNCADPGISGTAIEAEVDAEWASAAAPGAKIVVAACADTSTLFGGLIAVQNLIEASVPPPIISMSYGECEAALGTAGNAAYAAAYQQAVAEGVSVFVSSGDDGAASCDGGQNGAYNGIAVNGFASTAYNVAVGGTDFSDEYAKTTSTYWGSNGAALSYIPEIPWNDSCAGSMILGFLSESIAYGSTGFCSTILALQYAMNTTGAGSGGPSNCASGAPTTGSNGLISGLGSCQGVAKPAWQAGVFGLPSDGVRDLPDVSMFASNGFWGHAYVECYSDVANGGNPCTGTPDNWTLLGGTSISAPILAGVQALINQKTGTAQGNPNYTYYRLAASEYGSGGSASCNSSNGNTVGSGCIFYDVTQGDITVNCFGFDCYGYTGTTSSFYYGVLSTSSVTNSPAFKAQTGWDFATGIGTVNVANLVNAWH